jgi:hypothetical protein
MSETTTETSTTDAAAETSGDSATEAPAPEAASTEGESALGDAGKKALDAMKAKWKEADQARKALEADFAAFKARADGKEAEFTAAQDAQRVKDEALAAANKRIVAAELRAAAKGKVNDDVLGDLAKFIDPSDFEVGDDGDVDAAAIAAAVDDLIKNKPSFAAQSKRFQGAADAGARNDAAKPTQLSQADLASMSPDAVNKARREGRLDDLLGIRK